jgi:hypothetical protein
MSLHEIRLGKEPIEAITFSLIEKNKAKSDELNNQVDEFIANGGKVKEIPVGVIAATKYIANEFSGENAAEQFDKVREVARKKRIRASMNAKFFPTNQDNIYHSDANKDKFVVIIGKYISKQFDYIHQAISHRNFKLKQAII